MIRILWIVLLVLLVRQLVRTVSALIREGRIGRMPRHDSTRRELDIHDSDIIDADYTEVDDEGEGR